MSLWGVAGKRFFALETGAIFPGNKPGENCPYAGKNCPYGRKALKHKKRGPIEPSLSYATSNLGFSCDDEKDNKAVAGKRRCLSGGVFQSMLFFTLKLVTRLLKSPALRSGNTSVRW